MTEIDELIAEARDLAAELNRTLDELQEYGIEVAVVMVWPNNTDNGRFYPINYNRVRLQITDQEPVGV